MGLKPHNAREIIADAISKNFDSIVDREMSIPLDVSKIVALVGPRRAGKTSVCFQLIKTLRATIPPNRLLYINFEDDRFFPAQLEDMGLLLDTYYSLFPENKDEIVYFFFDEVQEVPHWEKFIRRLFDQEKCKIYLTGSSSKLLSREIATALRGRTLSFEIFPLSFSEYLSFNRLKFDRHSSKGKSFLQKEFEKYFWQGGFPELPFLPQSLHLATINEYIDLMLYRDLTERFGVRNPQLLKYLLKYSLTNTANLLSINRVFNDLKSQGYQLSKNTVYEYLSYLEEAFILFRTSRWSTSIRQQAINPIKIYIIDQSFKYAMTSRRDEGRVLENIVYMAIRRLGYEPTYLMLDQEVDFYVNEKYLINVCYEMEEFSTRKRELEGLQNAMNHTGIKESILVTMFEEGEERMDSGVVQIIPARNFALSPHNYLS